MPIYDTPSIGPSHPDWTSAKDAPASQTPHHSAGPFATRDGPVLKRFTRGTHRGLDPEMTLNRVRPLLPAMGITRVANVTGLDYVGIPVVMVCRPNSRSLSVAQGKGLDLVAAKISGIMEAAEGYHSQHITHPLKYASYDELRFTHDLADVARLPIAQGSNFHPDFRLHWIEGVDLVSGARLWVPYEMVHTDYTLPATTISGCFLPSSSGLGCGNHLLEAASHGICEAVESDARALWRLLPREAKRRTLLDQTTVDDPDCLRVMETCDRAQLRLAIWNLTTDIGIACFYAALTEAAHNRRSRAGWCGGVGCHPVRGIALLRALTEAAQSRLTLISGARDDISPDDYRGVWHPSGEGLEALARPIDRAGQDFRRIPSHNSATFDDDIRWELARLAQAGVSQVIAVDLTRVEFDLPVVRIVIPGLEGLSTHRQYRPGQRAKAQIRRSR